MRIDLLRHGACLDQVWLRGRVDSELSNLGWQSMHQQLERLQEKQEGELGGRKKQGEHRMTVDSAPYDKIITSPAKRCAAFTQHALQTEQAWSVSVEEPWQERSFGDFDGLSFEQVQQQFPDALAHYLQNPYVHTIPNAETFEDFKQRIDQAWSDLIQQNYQRVLLVTHSGPMRLVLQRILLLADPQLFQFELDYAARITIEVIPTETTPFCKLVEIVQAPAITSRAS